MSSSTDNLGLTLPADGERLSLGVLNQNWQKLDDFAGLFMIDYGSKTVSAFNDALSTTMGDLANGQSVSFAVNFTDTVSPMSSGAHTGVATKSSSTRINVILQRSGSETNENYIGSLTSNGWSWDKVATKSQLDAINSQLTITTPTGGEYTSVVNSSYTNRLYIRKYGKLVSITGEFKATNDIGNGAIVIATGCPAAISNSIGQFTAFMSATPYVTQLDVSSNGDFTTFYGSTIPSGAVVRFGHIYMTNT